MHLCEPEAKPQPLSAVTASSPLLVQCSQPLCPGQTVRCLPALLATCWFLCQVGTALHSSLQGGSLLPSGKAFSAGTVEELERAYLPAQSRFVAGSAFILETQQNRTAGIIGVWATTHSAKPLLSHRRISTPRSQSVGFKLPTSLMRAEKAVPRMAEGLRERQEKRSLGNNPRLDCTMAGRLTLTHLSDHR